MMTAMNEVLSVTLSKMDAWSEKFPDGIANIKDLVRDYHVRDARLSKDGLSLSIGIMGQVKAGKSSFLNALLFDGNPILPEAATPKTANLTKISFGEIPSLKVEFYSPEEWCCIENAAASQGDYAEAKVGRELVKLAQDNRLDVPALLQQREETIVVQDISGLMNRLNDYVGENGKYTAIVKCTELRLPLAELKGFEIVDTPGMNDPVPSRTQKTREYMAECDVVFFLSRCSQFLDQSDMDLLVGQLPGKGVKRMALVGAQFDGAILDDGYDRSSLAETERNIGERLRRGAEGKIEKLADFRDRNGDSDVARMLRELKQPILASSFAYGFANWPAKRWGKNMRHMYEELSGMAQHSWDGYCFTIDDWQRVGNFSALRMIYDSARADKKTILQAQRDGLVPEVRCEFKARLMSLENAVEQRANQLRKGDIKEIEHAIRQSDMRINLIAGRLAEVIDADKRKVAKTVAKLKAELEGEAVSASSLKTRIGTKTVTTSCEVSTSVWYNPFSWGDTETVYDTETKKYKYLATADAIENVVNFANANVTGLRRELASILNPKVLKATLKHTLLDAIDTSSEGFDPAQFRATLEGTLDRLKLPELHLKFSDPAASVSQRFSGKVKSEKKMEALRESVRLAVAAILQELKEALQKEGEELSTSLDNVRNSLAQELSSDLNKELERVRAAFANKERELASYGELLEICRSVEI